MVTVEAEGNAVTIVVETDAEVAVDTEVVETVVTIVAETDAEVAVDTEVVETVVTIVAETVVAETERGPENSVLRIVAPLAENTRVAMTENQTVETLNGLEDGGQKARVEVDAADISRGVFI